MVTKAKKRINKKFFDIDEIEINEINAVNQEPVKLEVFHDEPPQKEQNVWSRALTPMNIILFIVAAVIMALAIMEAGRSILDFVAALVFIAVMIKIFIDGYNLK